MRWLNVQLIQLSVPLLRKISICWKIILWKCRRKNLQNITFVPCNSILNSFFRIRKPLNFNEKIDEQNPHIYWVSWHDSMLIKYIYRFSLLFSSILYKCIHPTMLFNVKTWMKLKFKFCFRGSSQKRVLSL